MQKEMHLQGTHDERTLKKVLGTFKSLVSPKLEQCVPTTSMSRPAYAA